MNNKNDYAKYYLNMLLNQIRSLRDMLYDEETVRFFKYSFLIEEMKRSLNEYIKIKQVYIDNIIDCKGIIFAGDVEVEY